MSQNGELATAGCTAVLRRQGSTQLKQGTYSSAPGWATPAYAIRCIRCGASYYADAGGLRITECPVATDVGEVVTTEFVVDSNVENQVAVTAKVDVFEDQVPPPPLVAALLH